MGGASTKAGRRPNHMCVNNTPVEHYPELGLYVKREDLCCPVGPHFSKTRGVYAHIAKRPESLIGCLDTSHSQGGWATAQACKMLGKRAIVYRPVTVKMRRDGSILKLAPQQQVAEDLGATIVDLQAGRSAVLYHSAKKHLYAQGRRTYMMPNALKLDEMVSETCDEFKRTWDHPEFPDVKTILVSASSATIAAGVILGAEVSGWRGTVVVHMGYSRPEAAVRKYINKMLGFGRPLRNVDVLIHDEGYAYGDTAQPGEDPPFPCNEYYDLKAFRWWIKTGRFLGRGKALLWNIG